eukprot:TRINITY_DN56800_c0_g1_i2.p2 TRINITY_DN56800_c0_g1~~TRINITY_DN56800_c0_g1_i2.p2  ORF type:complete len:171 (-),score=44.34 TRINITY_DN56800_c0_g1_i2:59-571(-)
MLWSALVAVSNLATWVSRINLAACVGSILTELKFGPKCANDQAIGSVVGVFVLCLIVEMVAGNLGGPIARHMVGAAMLFAPHSAAVSKIVPTAIVLLVMWSVLSSGFGGGGGFGSGQGAASLVYSFLFFLFGIILLQNWLREWERGRGALGQPSTFVHDAIIDAVTGKSH